MVENGKISALQMGFMMYPTIIATAILYVPAITIQDAGRDMWMSPIWASFVGFLSVFISHKLNRFYPKETIIQYSGCILGFIPGKIIGFFFLMLFLHMTGGITREYAEFIVGAFLPRTPISVVVALMALVCAFAVRAGVEVLGRLSEIIVPILILLIFIVMLLLAPDFKTKNLFPVMENGVMPSIKGAFSPFAWFSEFTLISFLLPFLKDREKGLKWGMISVFAVMFSLLLINVSVLLVFGEGAARIVYPVMTASRYISIADFFENLESIVMAIWMTGAFIKISMFYYSLVLGTAQWLNLSNYRPIVFPLCILVVINAFWFVTSVSEMVDFFSTVGPFYMMSVLLMIPLFLLLAAYIRNRDRKNKEKNR